MTDPEAWEATNERGPFVTIRAGGPLEGVVTITQIPEGHGRTRVIASWIRYGQTHWHWIEVESFEHARLLARQLANELAAGREPQTAT